MPPSPPLTISTHGDEDVELAAVDVALARAFWEGVPAARLLARVRLQRDEQLGTASEPAGGLEAEHVFGSTWDTALAHLLAAAPASLDRIRRAVARHARAASDEGPLRASDAVIAALVSAILASDDQDASPAEGAAGTAPIDDAVARACARIDERLGAGRDRRAPLFEACIDLATHGRSSTILFGELHRAANALAEATGTTSALEPTVSLYPPFDSELAAADRRIQPLDNATLERILLRPERELDATIARAEAAAPDAPVAELVRTFVLLRTTRAQIVVVLVPEPRSQREPPRLPPSSWQPSDFSRAGAEDALAAALERGSLTLPRARALVLRGGHAALDGIGAEMMNVGAHPFASAAFAEILASAGRERDAVRLVGYFAIAPDPVPAARALAACTSSEVPALLRAWLESTIPTDAEADAASPTRARFTACLRALEPHPELYAAVRSLVERLG